MNKHRNEFNIKIGGDEYTIRPSLEVLETFEENYMSGINEILEFARSNKEKPAKTSILFKFVGYLVSTATDMNQQEAAEYVYASSNFIDCMIIAAEFNASAYYIGEEKKPAGKQSKGKSS